MITILCHSFVHETAYIRKIGSMEKIDRKKANVDARGASNR